MLPCPRRSESRVHYTQPDADHWRDDNTCSYCGSLNSDRVMMLIEAGAEVIPTDKSYKLYVRGEHDHREWKAYFQHFTVKQQQRFVELLNAQQMRIGQPGYFYVLPFFCTRAPRAVSDTQGT